MKRVLSLIMVLAMLLSMAPAVYAEDTAPSISLTSGNYVMKMSLNGTDYYAGEFEGNQFAIKSTQEEAVPVTITVTGNTATIASVYGTNAGKLVGHTGTKNTLAQVDGFAWTITGNADGTYAFGCNTDQERYMALNGGNYWRCYKAGTVAGSSYTNAVTLIPFSGEYTPPVADPDPTPDTELTIAEAYELGNSKAKEVYTEGKYYVTGTIASIDSEKYGNMIIEDGEGNSLYIYGTYSADGTVGYANMETKPAKGDTVKLYGVIGKYNAPQMKSGWIVEHTPAPPAEETLTLVEGENAVTLAPNTNYTLIPTMPEGAMGLTGTLAWTEGVTVTVSGTEVTSPFDLSAISGKPFIVATVAAETEAAFTLTIPEEELPQLVEGENAIETPADGVSYAFTSKIGGDYVLSAAEGEENAVVMLVTETGSEEIALPYEFTLGARETIEIAVYTADWSADTINLVLALAEEELPELIEGENAIEISEENAYMGVDYTFTSKAGGTYVLSAGENGEYVPYIMAVTADGVAESVDLPYTFTLAARETITFNISEYNYAACTINLILALAEEEVPVIELALGDNAIVVEDGMNGTEVQFTATEAGNYELAAAEGEENAYMMVLTETGSEGIDLPHAFQLEAGETIGFVVATNDMAADTIDLVLAKSNTYVNYKNVSVSLAGDIGLNYYVEISEDILADAGAYLEFTVDGAAQKVMVSEAKKQSDGTYRFSAKLAAKDMACPVVAQVYTSEGPVGIAKEYSVRAYCTNAIPVYSAMEGNESLVTLLKAMLNYGAASQVSLKHNVNDPANFALSAEDQALADLPDVSAWSAVQTGSQEGITPMGASLMLKDTTTIRFYFQVEGDIAGYTFTMDGKEVTPVKVGSYYCVDKVGISARNLDEFCTVSVGGYSVSYCGLSYIPATLKLQNVTEEAMNMVKALWAYSQAAESYFNK